MNDLRLNFKGAYLSVKFVSCTMIQVIMLNKHTTSRLTKYNLVKRNNGV